MNVPDPLLADLLDTWPVAHLTSITPDARPHAVPIVFCRDGATVYSPIDGKTKQGGPLQREANIAANPQVCMLLDAYDEDWQALWWVRLDGTAERYSPEADHAVRLRSLLRAKYPQYDQPGMLPAQPGYLRIGWSRVIGWAQAELAAALRRAIASRRG
jgi:PPOX class probable F420-dependent enzyme